MTAQFYFIFKRHTSWPTISLLRITASYQESRYDHKLQHILQ